MINNPDLYKEAEKDLDRLEEKFAIVYWCFYPQKIAAMDFGQLFQLATTRQRGLAQQRRLKAGCKDVSDCLQPDEKNGLHLYAERTFKKCLTKRL